MHPRLRTLAPGIYSVSPICTRLTKTQKREQYNRLAAFMLNYCIENSYVEIMTVSRPLLWTATAFFDATPCSLAEVDRRFGGTYCVYLQRRKVNRESEQAASRVEKESADRLPLKYIASHSIKPQ
jgi:hypothetical protein